MTLTAIMPDADHVTFRALAFLAFDIGAGSRKVLVDKRLIACLRCGAILPDQRH